MKKRLNKIVALLLCLVMLAAFAGCGKDAGAGATSDDTSSDAAGMLVDFEDETASVGNDKGDASAATGSSGNKNDGDTNVTVSGGTTVEKPVEMNGKDPFADIPKRLKNTTVTFAHFGDEGADEYQKVFKAFTKKTGIKVKIVSFNQEQYVSQVAKQINGGAAPDVIICNDVFPNALEIAQPIQNIINLNDDFWDDEITKATTVGKNTYFVNSLEGVWENVDLVVYNKQIFTNNGITSPADYWKNGTWTYENLKKCLEQVKKTGNIGGYCDPDKLSAAMGSPIIGYNADTKTFTNNIGGAAPAYQFASKIFKEGLWSSTDWWGTFANGNIGLYLSGGCYGIKYNGFFKETDPAVLAAVPMPTSYQGKACKPTGSLRAYGIAKGAKNPEGGAYFLRYFLDYEYYKDAGANVFMNKSVEKVYWDQVVPELKKNGRILDFTSCGLQLVGQNNALSEAGRAEEAQVPGLLSAQKNVAQNAADKMNEKIKSYK